MGYPAPMRRFASILVLAAFAACGVGLAGCGAQDGSSRGSGRPEGWPGELLTSDGSGPALYLGPEADDAAIGYVSPGVTVRIAGAPQGDRIPVWIDGPLKVRGWLVFPRLAGRVTSRGRVAGTPTYVGPNDIVGIRGPGSSPGSLRVEVSPWLGRDNAPALGPFIGELSAEQLGADEIDPASAEGPSTGEPHMLPAGQEIPVYDRPSGEVIATLPALDPPLTVVVLRDSGGWKGIRAGVGPYLVGFVNAQLTPAPQAPARPDASGPAASGEVPHRLAAESERRLWRVPTGARIRFDGTTIAQLRQAGFAREMNRYASGEVDVFVAINDDVAIRGMMDARRLEAYEGAEPAPPAPEQPVEPVPPSPAPPIVPGEPTEATPAPVGIPVAPE